MSEPTSENNRPLQVFEEPRFGIKMRYPENWNKKVTKSWILFYPPMEKEAEDSGFWIMSGHTDKLTTDDYVKQRINTMRTTAEDFNVLESSTDVTLSGKPGYKLVYIRRSLDRALLVKRIEFGTIIGRDAYTVNGGSETPNYSKYLPIIEKMISSIKLTKIG